MSEMKWGDFREWDTSSSLSQPHCHELNQSLLESARNSARSKRTTERESSGNEQPILEDNCLCRRTQTAGGAIGTRDVIARSEESRMQQSRAIDGIGNEYDEHQWWTELLDFGERLQARVQNCIAEWLVRPRGPRSNILASNNVADSLITIIAQV